MFVFCNGACGAKDSLYIKRFKDQLVVSAYVGVPLAAVDYEDHKMRQLQNYMPNMSTEMGLGVSWNRIGVSTKIFSFRPPDNDKYGKTKAFDFQSYWYPSRLQITFSLQNYSGFYTEDEKNNDMIIVRPDLKIKLYKLYGEYLFNHKRFSSRAAYTYDEKQLLSEGTLKVGLGVFYSSLSADSTLSVHGTFVHPHTIEDYQLVPSAGYAYHFVFGKRRQWFANLSMTFGLGISVKNGDHKVRLYPNYYPRIAFGYIGKNWSLGMTANFIRSQVSRMERTKTNMDTGYFKLSYSYRFPFDLKRMLGIGKR